MRKIIKVKPLEDYKLELVFDNNEIKIKDMKPYLNNGIFKSLIDKNLFNSVKVSFNTISWGNDIDLCADYLYNTSTKKYKNT